jgi:hypothetical protein
MSDPERNIHSFFDKLTSISDELKEIITDGSDSEIINNILILIDELEWTIEENVSHNRDPEDGSNELFVSILVEFDILSSNFNEALKTKFKERIEECKTALSRVYDSGSEHISNYVVNLNENGLTPGPAPSAGGRNSRTRKTRKSRKSRKSRKTRKSRKSRKTRKY